jgi:hypothetical protein
MGLKSGRFNYEAKLVGQVPASASACILNVATSDNRADTGRKLPQSAASACPEG